MNTNPLQIINNKRVLIFYTNFGCGHKQAAFALRECFVQLCEMSEVKCKDALFFLPVWQKALYRWIYNSLIDYFPGLWDIIYCKTNQTSLSIPKMLYRLLAWNYHKQFINFVNSNKPDLIIATHCIPLEFLSFYAFPPSLPIIGVITDFSIHQLWLKPFVSFYTVANKQLIHSLKLNGISQKKIIVTGIPVSTSFLKHKEKQTLIAKHKLQDKFTVLVMGGGEGKGPLVKIVRDLKTSPLDLQIVVVTGKNKKLYQKLLPISSPSLKILGFVDYIDELMEIADIVISKPGGITIAETMIKGKPIFLFNSIQGQESENMKFIINQGIGIPWEGVSSFLDKIAYWQKNPDAIKRFKEEILKLSKPDASSKIVELAAKILQSHTPAIG